MLLFFSIAKNQTFLSFFCEGRKSWDASTQGSLYFERALIWLVGKVLIKNWIPNIVK